jgi:predicted RNase H-like HicB family nuclease
MANITFHAIVSEEDDGSLWARVEELPGCFASGFSMEELREALAEAVQLCLPEGIAFENPTWEQVGERELLICA